MNLQTFPFWKKKLLIRRYAPYIPLFHANNGAYTIKGHCMTFPQDITEMCDALPLYKESILTFIRYLGNKETQEVFIKQLRARKDPVIVALNWKTRAWPIWGGIMRGYLQIQLFHKNVNQHVYQKSGDE